MKPTILILFVEACLIFVLSIRAQSSQSDGSYESAIASLSENSDPAQVARAIAVLESAGTKAFPALLAHLNDTARASVVFQNKAIVRLDAKGNVIGHHPTIAEVCFDLIQGQVEGNWPKGYRQLLCSFANERVSWWQARKEKSLKELQLEAAQESLIGHVSVETNRLTRVTQFDFLSSHLRELKAAKK